MSIHEAGRGRVFSIVRTVPPWNRGEGRCRVWMRQRYNAHANYNCEKQEEEARTKKCLIGAVSAQISVARTLIQSLATLK